MPTAWRCLPADEEADYQRLEVQDRRMAISVYAGLAQIDDAAERDHTRESLLAYCRLDTLAMVKIWQRLATLVESAD
jgi:hypothetical protein